MADAFVGDVLHLACGICPARRFPVGQFDVHARPTSESPFDPVDGHRYTVDRVPVCVHPEKVGLPAGKYMSAGETLRGELTLPADQSEVVSYLHDVLYGAAPILLDSLIEQAKAEITRKFPGLDVTATLRRALS